MTHFAATCPDDSRNHRSLASVLGAAILRAVLREVFVLEISQRHPRTPEA